MKNALIILSAFILFSCNSDDDDDDDDVDSTTNPTVSSLTINSFKETIDRPAIDGYESYKEITAGDIVQNKFMNYTVETYFDDELKEDNQYNYFIYQNEKTTEFYPISEKTQGTTQQLFYDNNSKLSGIYWEKINRYYRIIHNGNNIDYFERLTGSLENPNTEVIIRHILKFDNNDNVIKAGIDQDLDGVMDFENKFIYDESNNLTTIEMANGTTVNISYSSIKNTKSFVLDNSFGKRVRRLFCSEVYGSSMTEAIENLEHSTHLTNKDLSSAISIETNQANFYTKYQREGYENATHTIEFFFE
ncbi:hypothetical protein [Mesonia maritima]|uniref:YD repeat-containing protein n=1 Tax=Mesonia maritima TaxID=1793873 RepID=A0ABU1K3S6_9FLAO|nr:hypothetical protein [Mesonia maritima]MDR6300274.1 hypothetical protein [Mesonia maritima]